MERLGNYELQRELGRGATAKIFLARQLQTDTPVSLKVFHPRLLNDHGFVQRIQREIEVSASLSHPNIVAVREVLAESDPPALVMDYVDGENLEKFQTRLPYILPEISALIVIEILKALEYAHAKGLIHRDLKPENVLIRKDGMVFVTDFGLAKYADTTLITQTNVILGSLDYMAPEQACGDCVTAQSDLFSVGLILYFLTTGTRPFSRSNTVATLSAIRDEDAESPQKCNPKISGEFARIIQRSIEKSPRDRFQSAAEFRHALTAYLKGLGLNDNLWNLEGWIRNPTASTVEGLRISSEALIQSCELALKERKWDRLLEQLAHLSLKAPQSAALGRITDEYQKAKKYRGVRAWAPLIVFAVAMFFFLASRRQPVPEQVFLPSIPPPTVAPAQKPSLTGTVIFQVAPDVKVYWNGHRVDASGPLKGQPIGEHSLVLERPGFKTITAKVKVSAEEPVVVKVK